MAAMLITSERKTHSVAKAARGYAALHENMLAEAAH